MTEETVRIVIQGQDRLSGPAKTASAALGGLQRAAGVTKTDLAGVERASTNSSRAISGMSISANRGISAFVGLRGAIAPVLAMLAGGLIFQAAGNAIIGFNAKLEQSRIGWTTMLHSAEQADAMLRNLQKFATETPFEFPDVEQGAQRLLAMGFAAQQIIPLLTDIGNVASGTGKGVEGMNRIIVALGQMQSKGKVSGEEIMQLNEAGVSTSKIFAIMATQTGKSVTELQKMQEQGKLLPETFQRAFRAFSQQNFGGMMEAQSKTFLGALSTLKDNVTQAAAGMFKPIFDELSRTILSLSVLTGGSNLTALTAQVSHVVSQVVTLIRQIPAPVFQAALAFGALAAAVLVIVPIIGLLGPGIAALAGPIGIAIAASAALVIAWQTNFLGIQTFVATAVPAIVDAVVEGLGGLIDQVTPILERLGGIIVAVLQWIEGLWATWGENVITIVSGAMKGTLDNASLVLDAIIKIFSMAVNILSGNWQQAWVDLSVATSDIWKVMASNALAAAQFILKAWSWALNGLADMAGSVTAGPFAVGMQAMASGLRAGANQLKVWDGALEQATPTVTGLAGRVLGLHQEMASFNDDLSESGRRSKGAAAQLRAYAAALRQWLTPKVMPTAGPGEERYGEQRPTPPLPPVPTVGAGGAGGGAKDAAAAVKELIAALVALHPATLAAAAAIKYWDGAIASVNMAITANADQLKAAQAELGRMQDRLQDLGRQLDVAKRKLVEFSQPRLTGMGAAEKQIAAVQEQLKRISLAKSLGVPLSQIIARFPRLTGGMEQYLSTLPQTEGGLSKVLDQLQLMQSLSFDEKMRLLGEAAKDSVAEMDYGTAMAGTIQYKAQVDSLTLAITAQETAIRAQEQAIKSIQAEGEALNATLANYQAQLTQAKANQDAVTGGLTLAYEWFLKDRQAMIALGGEALLQVPIIDAQMRALMLGMDAFALGEAAAVQGGIVTLYETSQSKLTEINALVQSLNTTVTTTHVIRTVYEGGAPEGRALGGPVYAGIPYTVGETGKETFMPETNGRIIPHTLTPPRGGDATMAGGIDYDQLARAMSKQPMIVEMDGERVAIVVRDRLYARGAGRMGR